MLSVHQNVAGLIGGPTRYDPPITFTRVGGDQQVVADKIAVANFLTAAAEVTIERDSFDQHLATLVSYIEAANS